MRAQFFSGIQNPNSALLKSMTARTSSQLLGRRISFGFLLSPIISLESAEEATGNDRLHRLEGKEINPSEFRVPNSSIGAFLFMYFMFTFSDLHKCLTVTIGVMPTTLDSVVCRHNVDHPVFSPPA